MSGLNSLISRIIRSRSRISRDPAVDLGRGAALDQRFRDRIQRRLNSRSPAARRTERPVTRSQISEPIDPPPPVT